MAERDGSEVQHGGDAVDEVRRIGSRVSGLRPSPREPKQYPLSQCWRNYRKFVALLRFCFGLNS